MGEGESPGVRRAGSSGVRRILFVAGLLWALGGCGADRGPVAPERAPLEYGGGEFTQLILSGGTTRAYLVVVPPSARPDEPAPVVFVFHGTPQTVEGIRAMSDMDRVAGGRGWIVVYPQALLNRWAVAPQFYPATEGQNDEIFLRDILHFLDRDLNIDRDRIYGIGFSNGALMAQRVACDMGDVVAASVSVGSTMSDAMAATCPVYEPMPVLFFLGDRDGQFEWEGEVNPRDREYGARGTAEWWAERNECPPEPAVSPVPDTADDGTTVERWSFEPCDSGSPVEFYAVYGGGHTWPGSPVILPEAEFGRTSRDISAAEIAVEFMERAVPGG